MVGSNERLFDFRPAAGLMLYAGFAGQARTVRLLGTSSDAIAAEVEGHWSELAERVAFSDRESGQQLTGRTSGGDGPRLPDRHSDSGMVDDAAGAGTGSSSSNSKRPSATEASPAEARGDQAGHPRPVKWIWLGAVVLGVASIWIAVRRRRLHFGLFLVPLAGFLVACGRSDHEFDGWLEVRMTQESGLVRIPITGYSVR